MDRSLATPLHRYILGMRVDLLSPDEYVPLLVDVAKRGTGAYCCVSNVHQCVLAHDDPSFRAVINQADFVLPDSTILLKALSLKHRMGAQPALRGSEMMLALCRAAEAEGVPIGLLGGRDDEVLAELRVRLLAKLPRLQIPFTYSPPFRVATPAENTQLACRIRTSGARLIFVGLGCPKQERWMAENKSRVDGLLIGVGAAFDFISGAVKPSPPWVHKIGLEWLYRLVSEPRRLWRRYLTTSPRFLALLAADMTGIARK